VLGVNETVEANAADVWSLSPSFPPELDGVEFDCIDNIVSVARRRGRGVAAPVRRAVERGGRGVTCGLFSCKYFPEEEQVEADRAIVGPEDTFDASTLVSRVERSGYNG
jgi:hypothetical protein